MKVFSTLLVCCVAFVCAKEKELKDFVKSLPYDECQELFKMVIEEHGGQLPQDLVGIECEKPVVQAPMQPQQASFYQPPQMPAMANLAAMDQGQMETIAQFMDEFNARKQFKLNNYKPQRVMVAGTRCYRQSDCPLHYSCQNVEGGWQDYLEQNNDAKNFPVLKEAFGLQGHECTYNWDDFVKYNVTNLIPYLYHAFYQVQTVMNKTAEQKEFEHFVKELHFVFDLDFDQLVTTPVTRQLGLGGSSQDPSQQLITFLALSRGGLDPSILPILLLTMGQSGGVGGNLMSNPIMLSLLLNPQGISGGNSALTILLLSQSLGSGSGFGGSGPTSGISLPLLLLLTNNQAGSSDPLTQLLPLLMSGGNIGFMEILLISGLLNTTSGSGGLSSILPLLLMGGGGAGGLGGMDPSLLLLLSGGLGSNGGAFGNMMDNPLMFFLLFGGLGSGGSGMDSSLLLLLLGSNGTNSDDLMKILFLSDPRFAQNPLAMMVLFGGGNLFGGNTSGSSSTGMDPLMLYILFLSGGNNGLTGSQSLVPTGLGGIDNTLPPPGGAIVGPSVGGTSSFLGGGNTGFGAGIFEMMLLMMMSGGGTMDPMMMYMLMFLMNPQSQAPAPVDPYYPGGSQPIYQPDPYPQPAVVNQPYAYDPYAQGSPVIPYTP